MLTEGGSFDIPDHHSGVLTSNLFCSCLMSKPVHWKREHIDSYCMFQLLSPSFVDGLKTSWKYSMETISILSMTAVHIKSLLKSCHLRMLGSTLYPVMTSRVQDGSMLMVGRRSLMTCLVKDMYMI